MQESFDFLFIGFHHSFPQVKHSQHQSKSKCDATDLFSAELFSKDKFP